MAYSGRELRIYQGDATGTPVAGARTDGFTIANEPIDVTDKDDDGWRTLIADPGTRSVDMTIEGVFKSDALLTVSAGATSALLAEHSIKIDDVAILNGDFYLNNIQLGAAQDGEVTFSASLQSSGAAAAFLNTVAPAVTGTPTEGQTLTTTNGTWSLSATFARQWQRNTGAGWANIAGATNLTYVLATADVGAQIRCRITATATFGVLTVSSNEVGPVAGL